MELGYLQREVSKTRVAATSMLRTGGTWNILVLLVAVFAGAFDVWLLLGWREIDPLNLSWLSGDSAVYQVGWDFFRSEPSWHVPLTWIARLDYPTGASASYFDFIPLVAIPLRLISPLLPAHFQYLGLYAVACFILQSWFGLRLVAHLAGKDRVFALLGGAFFLLSPILTKELYGQFALLSQWLVLASLYYYFRLSPAKSLHANMTPFVVLGILAGGIQPYFALMVIIVGVAAAIRACALRRTAQPESYATREGPLSPSTEQSFAPCAAWAVALLAATIVSLTFFGFIVPGKSQFAGIRYTDYSMNLLGPINPQTPWALYIKAFPVVHGWTLAGYDYLGMGVLLLLFIALARSPGAARALWSPAILPLTAVAVVCTLLALSVQIGVGDHVLFTIPLPKFAFDLLASFRASGRLFWPAYYLLLLAAIAGIAVTVHSVAGRRVILAAALVIQVIDILPIRDGVAAAAQVRHPDRLLSPAWAALPARYHHLVILPAFQCSVHTPGGLAAWPQFAELAASGGMTLNSVYIARISPQALRQDCVATPAKVLQHGLAADTVYVLGDKMLKAIAGRLDLRHECRRVDGFNLCTRDTFRPS